MDKFNEDVIFTKETNGRSCQTSPVKEQETSFETEFISTSVQTENRILIDMCIQAESENIN
jgi:hypothetical protein